MWLFVLESEFAIINMTLLDFLESNMIKIDYGIKFYNVRPPSYKLVYKPQ